jgi:uncharacterized protein YbcI
VLEDVMTPSERSLAENGRADDVRSLRHDVHEVMRPALIGAVEGLSGSGVRALLGETHADPDVAVEVFLLAEPLSRPGMRAADRLVGRGDDEPTFDAVS